MCLLVEVHQYTKCTCGTQTSPPVASRHWKLCEWKYITPEEFVRYGPRHTRAMAILRRQCREMRQRGPKVSHEVIIHLCDRCEQELDRQAHEVVVPKVLKWMSGCRHYLMYHLRLCLIVCEKRAERSHHCRLAVPGSSTPTRNIDRPQSHPKPDLYDASTGAPRTRGRQSRASSSIRYTS